MNSSIGDVRVGGADLTKCDLMGSRIQRTTLGGLRGGESLRGVTISSDQLIPAALAVFASLKIRIDDDDDEEWLA